MCSLQIWAINARSKSKQTAVNKSNSKQQTAYFNKEVYGSLEGFFFLQ